MLEMCTIPYPDVFWYHSNSINIKKCFPNIFALYILHKKLNEIVQQKSKLPQRHHTLNTFAPSVTTMEEF